MNIKTILIDQYGYSTKEADTMENDLSMLDAQVATIFESWKEKGEMSSNVRFHGYSLDSLCADYGMNFFAALTTLDWIVKDPENALPAMKQGIM